MSTYSTYPHQFVDIHGRKIKVYIGNETGELFIPFIELKHTGFNLYIESQYNKLKVDDKAFKHEFNLHMLECATTYMLENKFRFKEDDVLATIANCKKILLGDLYCKKDQQLNKDQPPINCSLHEFNHGTKDLISSTPKSINITLKKSSVSNFQQKSAETQQTYKESINQRLRLPHAMPKEVCQQMENKVERKEVDKTSTIKPYIQLDLKPEVNIENTLEPQIKPKITIPVECFEQKQYTAIVSHVESLKLLWIQNAANMDALANMLVKINEIRESQPIIVSPEIDNYYLAEDESFWFRCKVIMTNPLKVFFIDYGNSAEVKFVRKFPSEFLSTPAQAVKISLTHDTKLKIEDQISLRILQKMPHNIYLAQLLNGENSTTDEEQEKKPMIFTKLSPIIYRLENQLKVLIIGENNMQFLLQTKDSYKKLIEIEAVLKELPAPEKITSPQIGQLVLTKRSPGTQFARAVIETIGVEVLVKFLDFGNSVLVSSTNLYHINERLANEPVTCILTPTLVGFKDREISSKSKFYLQNLIDEQLKCTVILQQNSEFVDFMLPSGDLLSDCLNKMEAPLTFNRFMLKSMDVYKPKIGIGQFMCNSFKSLDSITLLSYESMEYLEKIIRVDLVPGKPYNPIVGEVCWGEFEGMWYRCVVKSIVSNSYETEFIDFGNLELLQQNQLMELDNTVKDIPILGIPAKFVDYPNIENIEHILKSRLNEEDVFEIEIKCHNGMKYEIRAPTFFGLTNTS